MFQIIFIFTIVIVLLSSCANGDLKPLSCGYLCGINVITFIIYGWDKIAAINGWWRIMEFTLHVLSILGGSLAAFIAQRLFRHKTNKIGFQIIFRLIVAIHVVIGIYFLLQQFPLPRRSAY